MIHSDIFGNEDEFVFGTRLSDRIDSFYGSDVIFGRQGDDSFLVKSRDEDVFVFGGKGFDTLSVIGDDLTFEKHGSFTIITDDDGFRLVVRGVEQIDWIEL